MCTQCVLWAMNVPLPRGESTKDAILMFYCVQLTHFIRKLILCEQQQQQQVEYIQSDIVNGRGRALDLTWRTTDDCHNNMMNRVVCSRGVVERRGWERREAEKLRWNVYSLTDAVVVVLNPNPRTTNPFKCVNCSEQTRSPTHHQPPTPHHPPTFLVKLIFMCTKPMLFPSSPSVALIEISYNSLVKLVSPPLSLHCQNTHTNH